MKSSPQIRYTKWTLANKMGMSKSKSNMYQQGIYIDDDKVKNHYKFISMVLSPLILSQWNIVPLVITIKLSPLIISMSYHHEIIIMSYYNHKIFIMNYHHKIIYIVQHFSHTFIF